MTGHALKLLSTKISFLPRFPLATTDGSKNQQDPMGFENLMLTWRKSKVA